VLAGHLAQAPLLANVDPSQFEQLVLNLCTNAWQAIGERGGRIDVTLDSLELGAEQAAAAGLPAGRYAHLQVRDDGSGMSEEVRKRAFEPFFTTKPVGTGTGLGLAVVHGIVRAHQGGLTLQSARGIGSCFDLYLPQVEGVPAAAPTSAAGTDAAAGQGQLVLYLDDDEVMGLMVERLLLRSGFRVRYFNQPQQAIAAFSADPAAFDILVTDYNMPGYSGLEVVAEMTSLRPGLPTLLSSGSVSEELRQRAAAQGVSQVLEKQNTLEDLVAALTSALAGSALAQSAARPSAAVEQGQPDR
jgi:CheY-like chemotaxis protein